MERNKKGLFRIKGIIAQMYFVALAGLLIIGVATYFSQLHTADKTTKATEQKFASQIAGEVIQAIQEYPAWEWMIRYWYTHSETMDIEYDVNYQTGERTLEKCRLLAQHEPSLQIRYAKPEEIRQLSEEDQKLYAEITYSWIITRMNEINHEYGANFVYCFLTDTAEGEDAYRTQTFLLSGAGEGMIRGSGYGEVYTLGTVVDVSAKTPLRNAMRYVVENASDNCRNQDGLDYSGSYADYLTYMYSFDHYAVIIGSSYNLSSLSDMIASTTVSGTAYALIYQFLLIQLVMILLFFYGVRPLKTIQKNVREYTDTKNSYTVVKNLNETLTGVKSIATRNNEVGELAEDIKVLVKVIDAYVDDIERITSENERIAAELKLASQIQGSVLPDAEHAFPDHMEFKLYASMDPAREVGGDFYDFYLIDEDHLALVIADVSGKGVPAALFMMISKIILQSWSAMSKSPSEILHKANTTICDNNPTDMFVTVWIGILELSTGKLVASNAGHEDPAIYRNGKSFTLFSDHHAMVLGAYRDVVYQDYEIQLEEGDKLFVYTDGVPEATGEDNELFGPIRMVKALNRNPQAEPRAILANMKASVDEFVGNNEQFDDMTMLCVEYCKKTK